MKFFNVPFAEDGDKEEIPNPAQPDGSVSYLVGFGTDYELHNTDPNYKPIPRDGFNQLMNDITASVGFMQVNGFYPWQDNFSYPLNGVAIHDGSLWLSLVSGNTSDPVEGPSWGQVPLRKSTQEQAEDLADNSTIITPLRLGEAMDAHVLGMGQTWRDVTTSRSAGTTYTNTTGRPIMVSVTARALGEWSRLDLTVAQASFSGSTSGAPSTVQSAEKSCVSSIIPAGETYRIESSSLAGVLVNWMELR